jgi:N-acetyl-anhydromuramyl-L-alanine amidase AmpD
VRVLALALALAGLGVSAGVARERFRRDPGELLERDGDEIVVAGRLFHTGTRVVTWLDPGGYDATRPDCAFQDRQLPTAPAAGCNTPSRIGNGRRLSAAAKAKAVRAPRGSESVGLEALRAQVNAVVVHYDEAYTSAHCFKVLQDMRGLSCHFLLDLDGTIYQTCDLRERARHAGVANDRSVGIEIAHPGALTAKRRELYEQGAKSTRFRLPKGVTRGALKGEWFRPARRDPVKGTIQGRTIEQYDFTEAQYEALTKLLAALNQALPEIRLKAPRTEDGEVVPHLLDDERLKGFAGVIAHYHVSKAKVDPGPAFDWERVLKRARRLAR